MGICDICADIDGRPVEVERQGGVTLIGVAECNGMLALEHYRCDTCKSVIAKRFIGTPNERVWNVIEPRGRPL